MADVARRAQHHSDLAAARAREADALAKLNEAQATAEAATSEHKIVAEQLKQSQAAVQHLKSRLSQVRVDRDTYHEEIEKLKRIADLEGELQQMSDGRPVQLPTGDVKLVHTPGAMEVRMRPS